MDLKVEVQARFEEHDRRIAELFESWRAEVKDELLSLFRAEVLESRLARKNEAAAMAALDEQLWLTDQRLSQRIDEVTHAQRLVLGSRTSPRAAPGKRSQREEEEEEQGVGRKSRLDPVT